MPSCQLQAPTSLDVPEADCRVHGCVSYDFDYFDAYFIFLMPEFNFFNAYLIFFDASAALSCLVQNLRQDGDCPESPTAGPDRALSDHRDSRRVSH